MNFGSIWRRRTACERCRGLKVRCEFSGPNATSCIRCSKNNAECVTRSKDGKKVPVSETMPKECPQHQNAPLVMAKGEYIDGVIDPLRALQDARDLVQSLADTPLERAVAVHLYSVNTVQNYWHYFTLYNTLPYLTFNESLFKTNEASPQLVIACVTIVAITNSTKDFKLRELFIDDIYSQALTSRSGLTNSDALQALAALCFYALPVGERGFARLSLLYSLCTSLGEKQAVVGDKWLYPRLAASTTLLSMTFATAFEKVGNLCRGCISGGEGQEGALYNLLTLYNSMKIFINRSVCVEELSQGFDSTMTKISLLETESASSWPCFLIAKIKLYRYMIVQYIGLSLHCEGVLMPLFETCISLVKQLVQIFYKPDDFQLLPAYVYFFVCDACISLMALRYASFAAKIPIDVKVDCVVSMVKLRWEELARQSNVARQNFHNMLLVQDMAAIRIGVLDPLTGEVAGPGNGDFHIYGNDRASMMTRGDLINIFTAGSSDHDALSSMKPLADNSKLTVERLVIMLVCGEA